MKLSETNMHWIFNFLSLPRTLCIVLYAIVLQRARGSLRVEGPAGWTGGALAYRPLLPSSHLPRKERQELLAARLEAALAGVSLCNLELQKSVVGSCVNIWIQWYLAVVVDLLYSAGARSWESAAERPLAHAPWHLGNQHLSHHSFSLNLAVHCTGTRGREQDVGLLPGDDLYDSPCVPAMAEAWGAPGGANNLSSPEWHVHSW